MIRFVFVLVVLLSLCEAKKSSEDVIIGVLERIDDQGKDTSYKIVLPVSADSDNWEDPINYVNTKGHFLAKGRLDRWEVAKFHLKGALISDPVIYDGKVFLITNKGFIGAYDLATQKLIWSHKPFVKIFDCTISINDGRLFITADEHFLVLNSSNGSEILYKKFSTNLSSAAFVEGNIVYLQDATDLHAINVPSGVILWTVPGGLEKFSLEAKFVPISYKKGLIVSTCMPGQLSVVDTEKNAGNPLFNIKFSRTGDLISNLVCQPLVDKGMIYFAIHSGFLHKYDLAARKTVWHNRFPSIKDVNALGNVLFVTTFTNQVAAVSAETGKVVWVSSIKLSSKRGRILLGQIMINSGLLILTKGGEIITLNPFNGNVSSVAQVGKDNLRSFAFYHGKLYLFGENGDLVIVQ